MMISLRLLAAFAFVTLSVGYARAAELQVDKAAIINGRLVVIGKTSVPNQVVEVVGTGERTASLPSRRFRFDLVYLPDTCIVKLKAGIDETIQSLVSGCAPRGKDGKDGKNGVDGRDGVNGKDGKDGQNGKDGKDGQNGKDGKDGLNGITYGSLPGDGRAFQCWPSDLIGLWFIKDYPGPNRNTIAHITPDQTDGSTRLKVTKPDDPLKSAKLPNRDVTRLAELNGANLKILGRGDENVADLHGQLAPDCRSITWTNEAGSVLATWERH
jgi:hypothetical protein